MNNTVTRLYNAADFTACLSIFDSNVPLYFAIEERAEFCDFLLNIGDLEGFYLVLTLNDTIVACGGVSIETEKKRAALSWGMVHRKFHREGLGKHLMSARLEQLHTLRTVGKLIIATSQHTSGFYEKHGFTVINVTPDGFAPGLDRWEMKLQLK